jgi:hypothetical protein
MTTIKIHTSHSIAYGVAAGRTVVVRVNVVVVLRVVVLRIY